MQKSYLYALTKSVFPLVWRAHRVMQSFVAFGSYFIFNFSSRFVFSSHLSTQGGAECRCVWFFHRHRCSARCVRIVVPVFPCLVVDSLFDVSVEQRVYS